MSLLIINARKNPRWTATTAVRKRAATALAHDSYSFAKSVYLFAGHLILAAATRRLPTGNYTPLIIEYFHSVGRSLSMKLSFGAAGEVSGRAAIC